MREKPNNKNTTSRTRKTPANSPTHEESIDIPANGPEVYSRDDNGLLKNVNYVYNEDGSINWRAMIPTEYIVVNKDRFKGEMVPEDISNLDDRDLLILLAGIKEVAKLRGLVKRENRIVESGPSRAVVECNVVFLPNYESGNLPYSYGDVASATTENTNGFGQQFLETIAANRAFVRAVRNALRIDIVGSDELNSNDNSHNEVDTVKGNAKPWKILEEKAAARGVKSIEALKERLINTKVAGFEPSEVQSWISWEDIPNNYVWKLLSMLNKKKGG